jgi:hypothetical protein
LTLPRTRAGSTPPLLGTLSAIENSNPWATF